MSTGNYSADEGNALVSGLATIVTSTVQSSRSNVEFPPYDSESVIAYIIPIGIIVGALLFFSIVSFMGGCCYGCCSLRCFRKCRAKCCGKRFKCCREKELASGGSAKVDSEVSVEGKTMDAEKGKLIKQVRCRLACTFFWCFVMTFASVVGFMANAQFSAAIGEDDGVLDIVSDLFLGLKDFCNETKVPIEFISLESDSVIDTKIMPLLENTSNISVGTDVLIGMLQNFSTTYYNYTIVESSETFICGFCTNLSIQVNETAVEIEIDTAPLFEDINATVNSLEVTLVDQKVAIKTTTGDVTAQINTAYDAVAGVSDKYEDIKPAIKAGDQQREWIFALLFAFPLIPLLLTTTTILLKKTHFLSCQALLVWCTCTSILTILAIHMLIAILLADVCTFTDTIITSGISSTATMDGTTGGKILQSCLDNTRLIDVLNMSSELDFGNAVNFTIEISVGDAFNLSGLDQLESDVAGLSSDTFNGRVDDLLAEIKTDGTAGTDNGDVAQTPLLTRTNLGAASANTYWSAGASRTALASLITAAQNAYTAEQSASAKFDNLIYSMQMDMNNITWYTSWLQNYTNRTEGQFSEVDGHMAPMMGAAKQLINQTRCGFIGTSFRDMDAAICTGVLPSLAGMCTSMLLVCFCSLIVICLGRCTKTSMERLAKLKKKNMEFDTELSGREMY